MIGDPSAKELKLLNNIMDWEKGLALNELLLDEDRHFKRENMTANMTASEAPRCPKHPDEPQVQCAPDSKRAGQYLGQCRKCMSENRAGRGKEKKSPAATELSGPDSPGVNPVLILNFSHYPELFERINAEALTNMRTPDSRRSGC